MDRVIQYLRKLGHDKNPTIKPMFKGLEERDWEEMTLDSPRGQALVSSFQMMMGEDHEESCRMVHNRAAHYDGVLGEATKITLKVERCGHPDYLDEDDKILEAPHNTPEMAGGSGSWRVGCSADHPNIHAIHYHVNFSGASQQIRQWWEESSHMVKAAYADIGLLWIEVDSPSKAQIRISWQSLGGSTIGLAQLPPLQDAQACFIGFFCKFDPKYAPNVVQIATLDAHERGHNCKSGHITNDPIMHPSIRTGWGGSFRGTAFGDRLIGYFGGVPVPIDDDPPPPPTGEGKIILRTTDGRIELFNPGTKPAVIQPGQSWADKYVIKVAK